MRPVLLAAAASAVLLASCIQTPPPPPEADPRNFSESLAEGLRLEQEGDFAGARDAYEAAAARFPLNPLAHHALGRMRHRTGDLPGAIDSYQEAIHLSPRDESFRDTIYRDLGEAYLARGDAERAAASFQEAVRHRPEDPVLLSDLAGAELSLGRSRRAREALDRALTASPNYARAQYWMGRVEEYDSDPRRAEARYRKAILANPNDLLPYEALIKLLEREGRLDESEELARRRAYLLEEKTYDQPFPPGMGWSDPRRNPGGTMPPDPGQRPRP